ncbi:hypothetical protein K1T71_001840 [Dendrolimus kikuchii]|uniref:Uncharacterized protein n=1 Tax=Dendrolimus kikuchii TaxID=765133 RepID=A0ACC1DF26_9NEOP|nr:hypothetical protein K1T71_001840 [Dendrolimus kikuchii]
MLRESVYFCILLLIFRSCLGRDYQRYNANTDFLQHEGGVQPTEPKRNVVINQPTSVTSTLQMTNNAGGKRDYVANFPQLKPTTQTQRPTIHTPRPTIQTQSSSTSTTITHITQNSGGKRDYVAPQYPSTKPTFNNQQSTNKVKDLINFYDSKNNGVPSYSSIVQGTTNKNGPNLGPIVSTTKFVTSPTTPKSPSLPTKPLSFSAVVAGSNKPGTATSLTTPKPATLVPVVPTVPTHRPGSPVLPSTILNNNKNQGVSSNSVTDDEIIILSEDLLRKDVNNAAKYVTVNYQEKTTSQSKEDKASQPLLTVSPEAWNIPTIQKFVPLLDNYERDTLVNEYVTPQERNEENAFMDAIMATTVIRHLMNFLKDKGYVTPDPRQQRDFLKQLWFGLYSRGKGKISSSGFEHVFVSELKNGEVSGLHNWIYFSKEEAVNRVNYLGYLKYVQLNDKGVVMKLHFNQQGVDKPVDSMFIGSSPELEIALYTLCFVTRSDNDCKLKLANKDVNIITHTFRYRSKNIIGSAFPQI